MSKFKLKKEKLKRKELNKLHLEWKKLIKTKEKIIFPDDSDYFTESEPSILI